MEKNTIESKSSEFLNQAEVENIAQQLLALAKSNGASQVEVAVNFDKGLSVSTRLADVETVEFNQDKSFAVTVYFGKRRGGATSSDTTPQSLKQLVERACDIAKHSDEDQCFGLAEAGELATEFPELDLDHGWPIDVQQAISIAKDCEQLALDQDQRIINSDGCNVSTYRFLRSYANSHGFSHSFTASRHSKSCILLAKDQEGLKRDYDYTTARDPQNLVENLSLAQSAVSRTLSRLNPRKLSTRKCPVIFSSDVSNTILSAFMSAISGSSIYRKSSFLLDMVGQQILPKKYNIGEEPYLIGGLGSASYDLDGVQTRANQFIKHGQLQHYMLDTYSARRLKLNTTANAGGVHNLFINNDGGSFESLLSEMGSGLLVTSLMGSAVNLVTGDYSRGASGFWIEDGQIQYPVDEVTVASNLADMFMNIEKVASDEDKRKSTRCGSMLISKMTVAGT